MTWAFIISWLILAIGLAILTFGDEHDFYKEGRESKMYQRIYKLLHGRYDR